MRYHPPKLRGPHEEISLRSLLTFWKMFLDHVIVLVTRSSKHFSSSNSFLFAQNMSYKNLPKMWAASSRILRTLNLSIRNNQKWSDAQNGDEFAFALVAYMITTRLIVFDNSPSPLMSEKKGDAWWQNCAKFYCLDPTYYHTAVSRFFCVFQDTMNAYIYIRFMDLILMDCRRVSSVSHQAAVITQGGLDQPFWMFQLPGIILFLFRHENDNNDVAGCRGSNLILCFPYRTAYASLVQQTLLISYVAVGRQGSQNSPNKPHH